jgi:hypothetical protein
MWGGIDRGARRLPCALASISRSAIADPASWIATASRSRDFRVQRGFGQLTPDPLELSDDVPIFNLAGRYTGEVRPTDNWGIPTTWDNSLTAVDA